MQWLHSWLHCTWINILFVLYEIKCLNFRSLHSTHFFHSCTTNISSTYRSYNMLHALYEVRVVHACIEWGPCGACMHWMRSVRCMHALNEVHYSTSRSTSITPLQYVKKYVNYAITVHQKVRKLRHYSTSKSTLPSQYVKKYVTITVRRKVHQLRHYSTSKSKSIKPLQYVKKYVN